MSQDASKWLGLTQHYLTWVKTFQYDSRWLNMTWDNSTWLEMTWYDWSWLNMTWDNQIWLNMTRNDSKFIDKTRHDLTWLELDGVAPLITDPPPVSSTTLSKIKWNKVTYDNVAREMWKVLNIDWKSQVRSYSGLGVMIFKGWKEKDDSLKDA